MGRHRRGAIRLSLAQRILVIVAAALIPIIAALVVNEGALRRSREAEIRTLALAIAQQATLEMERLTAGADGILHTIAAAPVIQRLDVEGCSDFLLRLKPFLPQFTRVIVVAPTGAALCGSDPSVEGLDLSDRPYLAEALAAQGRLMVGEFTVSRISGAQVLPLAMAILGEDGEAKGVVVTAMDLGWLGTILRERQLTANGSLTIADRNGVIIAREPLPDRFVGTTIPEAFQPLVHATEPGARELTSQDGTRRILGYVPVGSNAAGLYVSAGIARNEAFGALNQASRRLLTVTLVAAAAAGLLSWLLGQRLVRGPVAQIATTLAARRAGDEAARTGMSASVGEIEALGATFDGYMDELTASQTARDRAEEALRSTAAQNRRLAERNELLAREMSHRVMNSFQLVEGTLALQVRRIADPVARQVVAEAEERIRSMALVHRQLFQITRDDVQQVDAAPFLHGLVKELAGAFATGEGHRVEVDAAGGLTLSPGQGIALGLLVTELVLNALKHAFKGQAGGRVQVALKAVPGAYQLIVEDNGHGMATTSAQKASTGVGMRLLDGFVRQLDGTLTIEGPPGTRFLVEFPSIPSAPEGSGDVPPNQTVL